MNDMDEKNVEFDEELKFVIAVEIIGEK